MALRSVKTPTSIPPGLIVSSSITNKPHSLRFASKPTASLAVRSNLIKLKPASPRAAAKRHAGEARELGESGAVASRCADSRTRWGLKSTRVGRRFRSFTSAVSFSGDVILLSRRFRVESCRKLSKELCARAREAEQYFIGLVDLIYMY
ncbi:hypothetical protein F2Q69_00061858 [Brassica cretica]|uniref:Uncharacterized protein n=1 Tax=Brassica cretica TaxID=69181 RepID=A0A8S9RLN3_BRACR|nr:hypothetical protein F2Q69_00061858 [Brassica cretica]